MNEAEEGKFADLPSSANTCFAFAGCDCRHSVLFEIQTLSELRQIGHSIEQTTVGILSPFELLNGKSCEQE